MLAKNSDYNFFDSTQAVLSVPSILEASQETTLETIIGTATRFDARYSDCMKMYAPAKTVAEYLDNHALWFSRCAEPMKVERLGKNGYALVIGRFGAFGYEVEPKIGLELLPPENGIYHIRTIPVPNYQPPGYDVDYKSSLQLIETTVHDGPNGCSIMTRVEWELHLSVYIHFPKFIQRLPQSLVRSTGDSVLKQVIRQVSRCLTRKVQDHFHESLGISFSKKR